MNPIIRRDHYLQKLIDRKENGLIKVITGIRRCGKSFLLFDLFYDHLVESGVREEQIIPIALKGKGGAGPLILDEACTHCGRCIDVCAPDVFTFSHRFNKLDRQERPTP